MGYRIIRNSWKHPTKPNSINNCLLPVNKRKSCNLLRFLRPLTRVFNISIFSSPPAGHSSYALYPPQPVFLLSCVSQLPYLFLLGPVPVLDLFNFGQNFYASRWLFFSFYCQLKYTRKSNSIEVYGVIHLRRATPYISYSRVIEKKSWLIRFSNIRKNIYQTRTKQNYSCHIGKFFQSLRNH